MNAGEVDCVVISVLRPTLPTPNQVRLSRSPAVARLGIEEWTPSLLVSWKALAMMSLVTLRVGAEVGRASWGGDCFCLFERF